MPRIEEKSIKVNGNPNTIKAGTPFIPLVHIDFGKEVTFSMIPNFVQMVPDAEMSGIEKIAWARLAQYAGIDGKCNPSYKRLGLEIGLSREGTKDLMERLQEKRFIRMINRKVGKKNLPNEIQILWHEAFDRAISQMSVGCGPPTGVGSRPPRVWGEDPYQDTILRNNSKKQHTVCFEGVDEEATAAIKWTSEMSNPNNRTAYEKSLIEAYKRGEFDLEPYRRHVRGKSRDASNQYICNLDDI
jgi:hypothetical protein